MLTEVACQGEGTVAQRRGPQWGRSKVLSSPRPRETQGGKGAEGRRGRGTGEPDGSTRDGKVKRLFPP